MHTGVGNFLAANQLDCGGTGGAPQPGVAYARQALQCAEFGHSHLQLLLFSFWLTFGNIGESERRGVGSSFLLFLRADSRLKSFGSEFPNEVKQLTVTQVSFWCRRRTRGCWCRLFTLELSVPSVGNKKIHFWISTIYNMQYSTICISLPLKLLNRDGETPTHEPPPLLIKLVCSSLSRRKYFAFAEKVFRSFELFSSKKRTQTWGEKFCRLFSSDLRNRSHRLHRTGGGGAPERRDWLNGFGTSSTMLTMWWGTSGETSLWTGACFGNTSGCFYPRTWGHFSLLICSHTFVVIIIIMKEFFVGTLIQSLWFCFSLF